MNASQHVAVPPPRPVMIFDGDCNFCRYWVQRWQRTTGDQIEYVPSQDPSVPTRFPELPRNLFAAAVVLVWTDGTVRTGAEAAFRALACNPRERFFLDWYEHSPVFARVTEWGYRRVARNRTLFSALTRLAWGGHLEPSTYVLARRLFLGALPLIYLVAFLSLWTQIGGLVGSHGIVPAQAALEGARQDAEKANLGWDRYHWLPTLCWFNASDRFLAAQCAAGAVLAALVLVGVAPALCLFLLWLIYLSLTTVCGVFLGFQWDNLLLEVGFLAIFFAPLQWLPRRAGLAPPPRVIHWLLRWLLFRLMFESGLVKLLSGDVTWRRLTALNVHYETQPLPTWIGWYVHQLPAGVHAASTALMLGTELAIPFLVFAPRRLRHFAAAALAALQLIILLTGNYCFFNGLTLALCLVLVDDAAVRAMLPARWCPADAGPPSVRRRVRRWPAPVQFALLVLVLGLSLMQFSRLFGLRIPWPQPMAAVESWLSPFRTFNTYGLFAVMTSTRPEIIIEGSNDGTHWLAYEFKYKPGDLQRRPSFVAPHQPRLDWQMWFAALSDYRHNPWFVDFCIRLLQGTPDVLSLLERNPFPEAPPRYLRAVVYEYHFTDLAARRKTGAWWRREPKGDYLPVISLRQQP